jgi:hypothetical protein
LGQKLTQKPPLLGVDEQKEIRFRGRVWRLVEREG